MDAYVHTKARVAAVPKVAAKLRKVDKDRRKMFGQRIKSRRRELQMTQLELAQATGQTYFTFVSNVEAGGTKIPSKDLHIWAKALNLPLNDFAKAYLSACDENLFNCLFSADDRATIL